MAMMPCTDNYCGGKDEATKHHDHNQNESEKDGCSPICFCVCCGTSFTIPEFDVDVKTSHDVIPYFINNFDYHNNYSFSFSSSIWHPPSLI